MVEVKQEDRDCLQAVLEMMSNRPLATWREKFEGSAKIVARHREAALTTAQAQAAAQEQRIAALEGTVRALIKLAVDGGLTHDLIAQLYPDSKKPNGQPALDFARHARRTINEARAALGEG